MADENATPEPMTPADCDLQAFRKMPLDVVRLAGSDLVAEQTPEENWAALLLWTGSWHQVPAASIPNSDKWQAKQAGYMMRGRIDPQWERVKDGALRGFVLCTDGRLYHPVVAEQAREAWISRLQNAYDRLADRTRKENKKRAESGLPVIHIPPVEEWISSGRPTTFPAEMPGASGGNPPDPALKGSERKGTEGKGTEGTKEIPSAPSGAGADAPPPPPAPAAISPAPPAETRPPAGEPPTYRDLVFALGVPWLTEQGLVTDKNARSMLAQLSKVHGEQKVYEAIQGSLEQLPGERVSWLQRVLRGKGPRNRQEDLEQRNGAVGQRWAQGGSNAGK